VLGTSHSMSKYSRIQSDQIWPNVLELRFRFYSDSIVKTSQREAKAKSMSQDTLFAEALNHRLLSSSSFGPHLSWKEKYQITSTGQWINEAPKGDQMRWKDYPCISLLPFSKGHPNIPMFNSILYHECKTTRSSSSLDWSSNMASYAWHSSGWILHPPSLPKQWMKSCSTNSRIQSFLC